MDSSRKAALRRSLGRRLRARHAVVFAALVLGLLILAPVADAHQWNGWHWNRGGSYVPIYVWDQTGGCPNGGTASNDALYDIYYNPHPIYIYCTSDHSDVSLFSTYEPGAWYCGLAEVEQLGLLEQPHLARSLTLEHRLHERRRAEREGLRAADLLPRVRPCARARAFEHVRLHGRLVLQRKQRQVLHRKHRRVPLRLGSRVE